MVESGGQVFFDLPCKVHFFVVSGVIDNLLQGVVIFFISREKCIAPIFDQRSTVGFLDAYVNSFFSGRGHCISGDGEIYFQPGYFIFVGTVPTSFVQCAYFDVDRFEPGGQIDFLVQFVIVFL